MASHQRVLSMGVSWADLCFIKTPLAVVEKGLFIWVSKTTPTQLPPTDSNMQASQMDPDTPSTFPSEEFLDESLQDYNLLYLPAWTRGLRFGRTFLGNNFPHPIQGQWIRSFRTNGTGPTKNIPCGSTDPFLPGFPHDNGYLSDLDFHISPTHTLSSKTGLKSLRSQAKLG